MILFQNKCQVTMHSEEYLKSIRKMLDEAEEDIKIALKSNKQLEAITEENLEKYEIAFTIDKIDYKDIHYEFVCPLICTAYKKDGQFFVKCELLDLIGTGQTINEAANDFYDEFDYIYKTYTSKPSNELSNRLQLIKSILIDLVKK